MKRILLLRACGINDELLECNNIKTQAELYEIEVHDYCPKNNDELEEALNKGVDFDYIYLSSHGDAEGFGNKDGTIDLNWNDLGIMLCDSQCMKDNCIVLLSCCRGGLNQVAYDLLICCPKISYIVGPRQSLSPHDMLISFNIVLYNLEHRNVDPIVACERIKLGSDNRFFCFDRLETEAEIGYIMKKENSAFYI